MAGTLIASAVKSDSTSEPPAFQNANGSEFGRLCRAWVSFVGSSGAILAHFNVAGVTRVSTGNYTIYFSNSMPSENFSVSGTAQIAVSSSSNSVMVRPGYVANSANVGINTFTAGDIVDLQRVYIQVIH
jgi:hypothetical protein